MASSSSKGKSNSKRNQKSGSKPGPNNSKQKARAAAAASQAIGPKPTAGMSGPEKVMWICLHLLVFLVPVAISNMNWLAQVFPSATTCSRRCRCFTPMR